MRSNKISIYKSNNNHLNLLINPLEGQNPWAQTMCPSLASIDSILEKSSTSINLTLNNISISPTLEN
jgi:hypothetical protein